MATAGAIGFLFWDDPPVAGDAEIGRELLNAGAERYRGIDGSTLMIEAARRMLRSLLLISAQASGVRPCSSGP
jgi:hypothetical protein